MRAVRLLVCVAVATAACGGSRAAVVDAAGDGPSPSDATSDFNIAFVTSQMYMPGSLGSDLSGADAACAASARSAGLPGTYLAFASTSTINAVARLRESRGWVRVDGVPVLDQPDDIGTGKMFAPIEIDEFGGSIGAKLVITGTKADGSTGNTCNDFTSNSNSDIGDFGVANATTINSIGESNLACGSPYYIYCFGIGKSATLTPVAPPNARRAFLTVQTFTPDPTGLAGADALCASEAAIAGLTGSFKALLPTSSASAISRFSLTGANWVRLDGVPLAATPLAFAGNRIDSPLNVTSALDYVSAAVATGCAQPADVVSDPTLTCQDWTLSTGSMGIADASFDFASSADGQGVNQGITCSTARLYCLEL